MVAPFMGNLANVLGGFGARANDLLRDTWKFTLSLNNVIPYSPVTWNYKMLDPIPFSRPMLRLEGELKALSKSIMDARDDPSVPALERLYEKVEPAFRVVFDERKNDFLPADAISLYHEQQQVLIFTYVGRTSRFVRSSYQDIFLRQLASQTLMTHPFLTKESLDRAGVELKAYARDFLRSLQRMYRTDIEEIFRNYRALLIGMHRVLSREPIRVPTYAAIPPRRIARTGAGVASDLDRRDLPELSRLADRHAPRPLQGAYPGTHICRDSASPDCPHRCGRGIGFRRGHARDAGSRRLAAGADPGTPRRRWKRGKRTVPQAGCVAGLGP